MGGAADSFSPSLRLPIAPSPKQGLILGAAALAVSLAATVAIGLGRLGMSIEDAKLLALFLALSGSISLAVGLGGIALAPRMGLGGLRARLIFAHLVVLVVAYCNVVVTAGLMFISGHDLGLLGLLLCFSAAIALCFAVFIAGSVVDATRSLVEAAQRMAAGDRAVRVTPRGGRELAELAEAFNVMAGKLAAAEAQRLETEQARRDLVAAVSHDLRTPLASIQAMVEAINDGVVADPETVQRYLRTVQAEVGHLAGLIDDLFELARLEAGALELHLSAGSVPDLLSDALESLQPQAEARGVRLDGRVVASLPPVLMDEPRVLRVIYNLVQNAVRHTPSEGTILLGAEALPEGVRIDVVDTGDGIAADDLPYIFDRFYRGEKSRARASGGAGLGLAIARGIVEAHGGRIWAENLASRGARFSFTLPKA
jgi:signal transduction histidine kinase